MNGRKIQWENNFAPRAKKVLTFRFSCGIVTRACRGHGGVAQLARARGSYPRCHRFKSSRRYHCGRENTLSRIPTGFFFSRPVGQEVKTRPFHGCNMGSIPVRVTKSALRWGADKQGGLAQLVRAPASHAGGHWFESSSLHHEKSSPCRVGFFLVDFYLTRGGIPSAPR